MNQEILNIFLSGMGVIITGLCSWLASYLVSLINAKIKDQKMATFLSGITTIVTDTVQAVYQESVQTLKEQGKFDEAAQKAVKEKALETIKSHLTNEMWEYIKNNFGDVTEWISEKIESIIYELKNTNKSLEITEKIETESEEE